MRVKGLVIFPTLFTAKKAVGSDVAKYSLTLLMPPNDPQLPAVMQEFNAAIAEGYPKGMPPGTDVCMEPYDTKFAGKEYYDPRFAGWMAISLSAKEDGRPSIVTGTPATGFADITDPSSIYSGCVCDVVFGMGYYNKGRTGVGGWLNGVLFNGEEGQFGRLDGRPTTEQMFGGAAPSAPTAAAAAPMTPPVAAPNAAPAPPAPPVAAPPAPPAAPVHQMTPAAQGASYEAMIAAGWTDALLIQHGMMLPPGGVPPVF